MEHVSEQDIVRLKEILGRTSEFIAYFELAETKMLAWRQEIEQCTAHQKQRLTQQVEELHAGLSSIQTMLSQNDLTCFRLAAESTLLQGKEHTLMLRNTGRELLQQFKRQQDELILLQNTIKEDLAQQLTQAIEHIEVRHMAQASHQIPASTKEKVTTSSISYSKKSKWSTVTLTCATSLIMALIIGFYLNHEYPWETHQRAHNERKAGKILLQAWPQLSSDERSKILQPKQTG